MGRQQRGATQTIAEELMGRGDCADDRRERSEKGVYRAAPGGRQEKPKERKDELNAKKGLVWKKNQWLFPTRWGR